MLRAHAAAILSGVRLVTEFVVFWQVGFLFGGGGDNDGCGWFCVMSFGVLVQLFVCVLMLQECETGEWDK